jgi:hypothetical protein
MKDYKIIMNVDKLYFICGFSCFIYHIMQCYQRNTTISQFINYAVEDQELLYRTINEKRMVGTRLLKWYRMVANLPR